MYPRLSWGQGSWTVCVHQNPQLLLCRAAFWQAIPSLYWGMPLFIPQVQEPAFPFLEFQTAFLCPSLQTAKNFLQGCTVLWSISHSFQVCILSKLAAEASAPSSKPLMNQSKKSGHIIICVLPGTEKFLGSGLHLNDIAGIFGKKYCNWHGSYQRAVWENP